MKNLIYIIIIFLLLLTLTGCSNKEVDNNLQIKRIEQINLLDVKYFTLYQYLSGIQINKEKLIVETEEMSQKQQDKHDSQEENDKINGTYRITDVINENNLLAKITDTNWQLAIQYFYEIQNVVYDIQIEMQNEVADDNAIQNYQKEIDGLMNNMIKQDKKGSILSLERLYYYSELFLQNYIKDENLYKVKKAYYDSIRALIYSELDLNQEYTNKVSEIKKDVEDINELAEDTDTGYIKNRINIIILNMEEDELKENRRLKLVMLIETIPSFEKHIVNRYDKE